MGKCSSTHRNRRTARFAPSTKALRTRACGLVHGARGCQTGPNGSADGAMVGRDLRRRQRLSALPGRCEEALRPAWPAGCRPSTAAAVNGVRARASSQVIGINAKAAMGDAATPLDMSRFDNQQAGPGIRQHAKVGHVPVVAAPSSALYWRVGKRRCGSESESASRIGENKVSSLFDPRFVEKARTFPRAKRGIF